MRHLFCTIWFLSFSVLGQVKIEPVHSNVNSSFWEDSPSISADGRFLVFTRSEAKDWPDTDYRKLYQIDLSDPKSEAMLLPFADSVYNVSYGNDDSIFFTNRRNQGAQEYQQFFRAVYANGRYQVTNLTSEILASYAHQVKDGSIYYFQYDGKDGAGLYRAQFDGTQFLKPTWLGSELSEPKTTSFDAFVSADESWMIFTSYFEEDGETGRTGFYFAKKVNGNWTKSKIEGLPYGWGANVTPDLKYFIFTDGGDIYKCRLEDLNIDFFKNR